MSIYILTSVFIVLYFIPIILNHISKIIYVLKMSLTFIYSFTLYLILSST